MNNKNLYKTGLVCAMAMAATTNVANAASCFGDLVGYCVENNNASFSVDSFGLMEMTVDNSTDVYTTDFLIDNLAIVDKKGVDVTPALSFFDYMDLPNVAVTPDSLSMTNLALSNWGVTVDLSFQLVGGQVDSRTAKLIETFTVTNNSGAAVDLSLLAFTDVDVGGFFGAYTDQGELTGLTDANGNPLQYRQFDAFEEMVATVDKAPTNYEVSIADDIAGDLADRVYNDGRVLLDNTIFAGQDNLAMVAEWLVTLNDTESYTYTKTMELNPVPVPAAVWLFGSGLLGLVGFARRNRS